MKKTVHGFTLVELLVVIGIMAVLGAIGLTVFGSAKGRADDGRRKSEIKSIADSIESAKDFNNRLYQYTSSNKSSDFPNNGGLFPDDPKSATKNYCLSMNTANYTPPTACTSKWTSSCPALGALGCDATNRYYAINSSDVVGASGILSQSPAAVKSWTLCASLDQESTPFCIQSLER